MSEKADYAYVAVPAAEGKPPSYEQVQQKTSTGRAACTVFYKLFVYAACLYMAFWAGARFGLSNTPYFYKHFHHEPVAQQPSNVVEAEHHLQFRPRPLDVLYVEDKPVPFEIFVMSKCPDAILVEGLLPEVFAKVGSIITFKTNYLATYAAPKFTCLHGDKECDGDVQQLCAAHLLPPSESLKLLDFINCQNEDKNTIGYDSSVEKCASLINIDPNDIKDCAATIGNDLFINSIQYTKNKGDVTKSATIYIDGTRRCVHDGIWKNCSGGHTVNDFVQQVCKAYTGKNKPAACK